MTNMDHGASDRPLHEPGRLTSPVMDHPRDAGSGDFVRDLENAVRENPISAALISMGVLWLFMGGSRTTLFGGSRDAGSTYDAVHGRGEIVGRGYRTLGRVGTSVASGADAVTSALSGLGSRAADAVSETISGAASHVSDAVSSAYESISSAAGNAVDAMPDAGASVHAASRAARQVSYGLSHTVQETLGDLFERQPLVLGAVGLGIGAALAAALPTTETESRLMGEASDALKEQAQHLVSDQVDKGRAMAEQAIQEIKR